MTPDVLRLIGGQAPEYVALGSHGDVRVSLTGGWRSAEATPIVGDFVTVRTVADRVLIDDVLPRHGVLRRVSTHVESQDQVLATNVDVVFLCFPVTAVNKTLLAKFTAIAVDSGAMPALLITKIDEGSDRQRAAATVGAAEFARRWPLIEVSAVTGAGVDDVAHLLRPDRTGVFIGSSGVGKSTLVNVLLGRGVARISATDGRGMGRHTTTERALFSVPSGGFVIDLPGLRSVLPVVADETVWALYDDVAAFASECRFSNCSHGSEPGCAIRSALEAGLLSEERVAEERQLQAEADWLAVRVDKRLTAQAHRKVVVMAKAARRRRRGQ